MSGSDDARRRTRERFDDVANGYDTRFVRFIDRYEDMHEVMLSLVRRLAPGADRILDLGCGTGQLTRRLLEVFPAAAVHGVDFSEGMVRQAVVKLAPFGARFTSEIADLAAHDPTAKGPWSAIVSALAIHHLSDEEKRELTLRACGALSSGGVWLNGDLVRGETDEEHATLLDLHVAGLKARGLPDEEIQERMRRHREHDIPARLSDQVNWLQEAGCRAVWAPWRYLHQAVIVGLR